MKKENRIALTIIIGIILIICLLINNIFLTLNNEIEYECNSGQIKLDLLINETNFTHFRVTEINGLTCKGKLPAYSLFSLG